MNPKVDEILTITQEECAEVIQEISKIYRFGIDNTHKSGVGHREKLEQEIGDLLAMIDLLKSHSVVDEQNLERAKQAKFEKLKIWSSIFKEDNDEQN